MEKIKLTTTLKRIHNYYPCEDGLDKLFKYIGDDYDEHKPINLLTILESNGAEHFIWALRAVEQEYSLIKPTIVSMAFEFAESVLHIFESKYVGELRPRLAIESARRWVEHPTEQNRQAAVHAADAAEAAAYAAAAAAYSAAYAASAASAYSAGYAAGGGAAERIKQAEIIRKYLLAD